MLGAMTMNVIITFFLLAVLVVVGTVVTYPDLPVLKLVAIGLGIAVAWPLFFYPMSYTLWGAVDLLMHPLEADDVADAEAHASPAWLAERSPQDA